MVAIDPLQVTGRLVLRMAFDDATDQLTCSFSLDDGATFQSPFPPLHVFQAVDEHEILLGANSIQSTTAPPPPDGCVSIYKSVIAVKKLGAGSGEQRVTFGGRLPFLPGIPPLFDPVTDGATMVVTQHGSGNPIWAVGVPPGTGCDPHDGWRLHGKTYSYTNVSNALPPGCIFGSAEGLNTLKLKDRRSTGGGIAFKAKANGATATADGSLVDGKIILGQTEQDGNCGSVLGVLCTARTGTVVCHGP